MMFESETSGGDLATGNVNGLKRVEKPRENCNNSSQPRTLEFCFDKISFIILTSLYA